MNLNKCLDPPVGILDLERLIEHCFEQTETLRFRGIVDNLNYYFDVILNKRQREREGEREGKKISVTRKSRNYAMAKRRKWSQPRRI